MRSTTMRLRAIADRLRELKIEAIAVCLLWSVLHPSHERRVGEILRDRLPGIPITLSHELNPFFARISARDRGGHRCFSQAANGTNTLPA